MQTQLSETDASLLSWLHALPIDTFSCPFEEKSLKINLDRFIKPNLEATWADIILTTPMKPKQLFPYNAVPTGRSRNTELMSRSLAPQYEGLSFGLNRSQIFNGINDNTNNNNNNNLNEMILNGNSNNISNNNNNVLNNVLINNKIKNNLNDVSRSIALFNLKDDKTSSADLSLNSSSKLQTTNNNNARNSTTTANTITDAFLQSPKSHLNGIKEEENQQNSPTQRKQATSTHSIDTLVATTPILSPTTPKQSTHKPTSSSTTTITINSVKTDAETPALDNVNMQDSSLFKVKINHNQQFFINIIYLN